MTVTTNCACCMRTITVPLALFETRQAATCCDAGSACPELETCRAT